VEAIYNRVQKILVVSCFGPLCTQVLPVSQLTNCSRADVRLTAKQPTCDDFTSNAEISRAYLFPPRKLSSVVFECLIVKLTRNLAIANRLRSAPDLPGRRRQ